ncbi:MAG: cytochrome P450 [Chloroflexi bacterium]|nr:cytochrome P450 [Chloroflexota bacterium]MCY3582956.1 cytochrome P450 [Chloroflexota bacterium]MCY3716860.1 cytochrome P450 [Chloroflexota bacterium]MDE2650073.1 cytochrome P450 [Chloroflexota bacterium]MXV92287.1 cytochrome P450 [Chloroflexota bacterium]
MQTRTACPHHDFGAGFDPLDLRDPFPALAQAQQERTVFYSPAIDYWVVTRHADIKAIFRDHHRYSAANTITPIVPFSEAVKQLLADGDYSPEPVLSNNVPPSHTRIRSLVNRLFTPRRMKSFAPIIRQIAQEAVAQLPAPPVDIVSALTYTFPAQVLFAVLGVPEVDVPQVKAWAGERIKLYYGRPSPAEQLEMTADLVPFWRYVVALVAEKAQAPGDDLISDLVRMRNDDDNIISLNEIASCMITLLVAGHETTTAQLSNALLHLLNPPRAQAAEDYAGVDHSLWQTLCEEPALVPQALEEMMRYDPSVCAWRRLTLAPSTIGGAHIPAGANLLLMLHAANRDPALFPEPDVISLTRDNLKEQLAFGYGIHYCVGAPLARLEMRILLETLLEELPALRLVAGQELDYPRNISFRGPLSLWVRW